MSPVPDADDHHSDANLADVLPFSRPVERHTDQRTPRDAPTPSSGPLLREVIGEVLRSERLEQERTLVDVARSAAVSLPYLSEVERGRKEVSSDVLRAICDALDLPLTDLLSRSARRVVARAQWNSGIQLRAA